MMHVLLRTSPEAFAAAARRLAEERQIWVANRESALTVAPGVLLLELSVGDATGALKPAEIRAIFAELAVTGESPGI